MIVPLSFQAFHLHSRALEQAFKVQLFSPCPLGRDDEEARIAKADIPAVQGAATSVRARHTYRPAPSVSKRESMVPGRPSERGTAPKRPAR